MNRGNLEKLLQQHRTVITALIDVMEWEDRVTPEYLEAQDNPDKAMLEHEVLRQKAMKNARALVFLKDEERVK